MKITFAINSMFFSILLSNKIIKKTILSKYPIFYFFLFIAMLTPFLDDIIKITKSRIKKQYEWFRRVGSNRSGVRQNLTSLK